MKNIWMTFAVAWIGIGLVGCGKAPAPTETQIEEGEKEVDTMMDQMKGKTTPPPAN